MGNGVRTVVSIPLCYCSLGFCTIICLLGSAILPVHQTFFSRSSFCNIFYPRISSFGQAVSRYQPWCFLYWSVNGYVYGKPQAKVHERSRWKSDIRKVSSEYYALYSILTSCRENWQDLFGILFPATAGIFAGASMSGDLKNPSKSIPRGTLHGLMLTFVAYTLVILYGATIRRESLYKNLNIIQDVCY